MVQRGAQRPPPPKPLAMHEPDSQPPLVAKSQPVTQVPLGQPLPPSVTQAPPSGHSVSLVHGSPTIEPGSKQVPEP